MACTKLAFDLVTTAFFGVVLVELARVRGVSYTKPALMANSTFVALSITSVKFLCKAIRSIYW